MVTFIRLDLSLRYKKKDGFNVISWLSKLIEYGGLLFTDRVIAVNTAIREEIIETIGRWKKMEIEVLFNNIPEIRSSSVEDILQTRKFLGIPENAKIFVTAGVLTPRKNIEILLRSFSKIGRHDFFLVIVGDSTQKEGLRYRDYLEALIHKLGLTRNVIITRWVRKEELWKILEASDLFVLPSLKEGMPNVMLEALGFDLPCLGSRIPGIIDILQYEELMFDPLDEEAIVDKVNRVFSDVQYSNYIVSLCRERKEVFIFDWKERVFLLATQGILS